MKGDVTVCLRDARSTRLLLAPRASVKIDRGVMISSSTCVNIWAMHDFLEALCLERNKRLKATYSSNYVFTSDKDTHIYKGYKVQ